VVGESRKACLHKTWCLRYWEATVSTISRAYRGISSGSVAQPKCQKALGQEGVMNRVPIAAPAFFGTPLGEAASSVSRLAREGGSAESRIVGGI
jgi:hypothetical protein